MLHRKTSDRERMVDDATFKRVLVIVCRDYDITFRVLAAHDRASNSAEFRHVVDEVLEEDEEALKALADR